MAQTEMTFTEGHHKRSYTAIAIHIQTPRSVGSPYLFASLYYIKYMFVDVQADSTRDDHVSQYDHAYQTNLEKNKTTETDILIHMYPCVSYIFFTLW